MQQRDRDVMEHIIRYCDRIAGYLDKLGNSRKGFWKTRCVKTLAVCVSLR